MNFVISMIPITNNELAVLSRSGAQASGYWMADAQAQRAFAGQPLDECSYFETLMPAIYAALGIDRSRLEFNPQLAICLSAHELAAACSRYRIASLNSVEPALYHTDGFVAQASNTVCAALVHWCPHVYITIDRVEG